MDKISRHIELAGLAGQIHILSLALLETAQHANKRGYCDLAEKILSAAGQVNGLIDAVAAEDKEPPH